MDRLARRDRRVLFISYDVLGSFYANSAAGKNRALAVTMLVSGLATDLIAIRHCTQNGPVIAAYALSRGVIERLDVLCLLIERPDLVDHFVDQDHSRTVDFWKKYISGGKARRFRLKFLAENSGNETASQAAKTTSEDFDIYSMAVHPSAPVAMANLFGASSKPGVLYWPGF